MADILKYADDPELNEFYEYWASEHNGSIKDLIGHNVYLIKTEDRAGNITGKAYATNLTLNSGGFTNCFGGAGSWADGAPFANQIYFGSGATTPTVHDIGLEDYVCKLSKVSSTSETKIQDACARYDPDSDKLYVTKSSVKGYIDYESPASSFDIWEIGLVYGSTVMTRGTVWDPVNQRAYIRKNLYEKLTISTFITTEFKPAYLTTALKAAGWTFSCNPWVLMPGGTLNINSSYDKGDGGRLGSVYTTYSNNCQWYYNELVNTGNDGIRSQFLIGQHNTFNTYNTQTYDETNSTITKEWNHSGTSWVFDDKKWYIDTLIIAGCDFANNMGWSIADTNRWRSGAMLAITKPLKMSNVERIVDDWLYANNEESNYLEYNIGYCSWHRSGSLYQTDYPKLCVDMRNHIPVNDWDIKSIKSYNGLTHEWDIVHTFTNNPNACRSMFVMCGMTTVRLWLSFLTYDQDNWITIFHNDFTDVQITSISSSVTWWGSNTWWNPESWVQIQNNSSVSLAEGKFMFYMCLGGRITAGGSHTVLKPVWVERDIQTHTINDLEPTIIRTNIDPKPQVEWRVYNRYSLGALYTRPHEAFEDMNYILMTNCIYYPEDDIQYTLQHSYSSLTNDKTEAFPDMKYMIRTGANKGKRFMQVFGSGVSRGSTGTGPNTTSPYLQKVSVFEVSSNSAVAPVEYVVDMGNTFRNDYQPFTYSTATGGTFVNNSMITNTETGYVVFVNGETNRVHIVKLMGDATSYDAGLDTNLPYTYILTDSDNNEIETNCCYAVTFRDYVIFRDITDTTIYKYKLFNLNTKQVEDEFTLSSEIVSTGTVDWIMTWKDYAFIRINISYDTYVSYIYDMTRPVGSRLYLSPWTTDQSRSIAKMNFTASSATYYPYTTLQNWYRLTASRVWCTEDCLIFGSGAYGYGGENWSASKPAQVWYLDETNIDEPINIAPEGLVYSAWMSASAGGEKNGNIKPMPSLCSVAFGTFNQGKQRIALIGAAPSSVGGGGILWNTLFAVDLNRVRDTREGTAVANMYNYKFKNIITDTSSNNLNELKKFPFHGLSIYKDRAYVVSYFCSQSYTTQPGTLKIIDPNRLLPHRVELDTYTVQCYNNPKRIYGPTEGCRFVAKNDPDVFSPGDYSHQPEQPDPGAIVSNG